MSSDLLSAKIRSKHQKKIKKIEVGRMNLNEGTSYKNGTLVEGYKQFTESNIHAICLDYSNQSEARGRSTIIIILLLLLIMRTYLYNNAKSGLLFNYRCIISDSLLSLVQRTYFTVACPEK